MMVDPFQFADLLGDFVERAGYNVSQLARRSGIPQRTLANWLQGQVKKPREVDDLLKVSRALGLSEAEATKLFHTVGYPPIEELVLKNDHGPSADLLAPWIRVVNQRVKTAPFQAVADLPYFVGREQEVETLKQALLADRQAIICSLMGMGGVGKTSLAAHLAYQLRPYFPDGVLWARVDTSDTMSILSTFAGAYGRDVSRYSDLDSRSRVVRELLAGKRVLVVLDNAGHSEEITPLLPPTTGSCAVIITTRHQNLSAAVGTYRFVVGPFSSEKQEALHLFAKLLGKERAAREKSLLIQLSELVGYLPLALAIAANRLAYEPGWQTESYLMRLRQEKKRLNELVSEEQNVRLSFNLSYRLLSPEEQRFFASLAVFGGGDFSIDAVAAITGFSAEESLDNLRTLYNLSLVQQSQTVRYRLHALLRDYAWEQLAAADQDGRTWCRMVQYFVAFTETNERNYEALDLEYGNILAALEEVSTLDAAPEQGVETALINGINACYHYWETRGLYTLAHDYLKRAEEQSRALKNSAALATTLLNQGRLAQNLGRYENAKKKLQEALALAHRFEYGRLVMLLLKNLGIVAFKLGDYPRSETHLSESLRMAEEAGNEEDIVTILMCLGVLAEKGGQYAQAKTYLLQGLGLARRTGDRKRICSLLMNLAAVFAAGGNQTRAVAYYEEALGLAREIGHLEKISLLLTNLGAMADTAGNYEQAKAYLQEGLGLAREIGHRERIAGLLVNLGIVAHNQGDYAQADDYYTEALTLARQLGHSWLEMTVYSKWGELYLEQRETAAAATAFNTSLVLGRELGTKEYTATVLYGLARVAATCNDNDEACRHGQESLSLFETIGHRKADVVGKWLASIRWPSNSK